MHQQRALIDLGVLLDLRLGALAQVDAEASSLIVHSDWYRKRATDTFDAISDGVIDMDVYRAICNEYRVETIQNALMTDFVYHLRKDVEDVFPQMKAKDLDDKIRFDVNIWPFKLLEEEKVILGRAIAHYLSAPAEIRVVDLRWDMVTPQFLDVNYDMMAIYNYEDWLKYHEVALYNHPIKEFIIFYPRVAQSGVVPEPDDTFRDPFMVAPVALMHHVQMRPVPSSWVSWNPEIYKKLLKKTGSHPGSEEPPLVIVPQGGPEYPVD